MTHGGANVHTQGALAAMPANLMPTGPPRATLLRSRRADLALVLVYARHRPFPPRWFSEVPGNVQRFDNLGYNKYMAAYSGTCYFIISILTSLAYALAAT